MRTKDSVFLEARKKTVFQEQSNQPTSWLVLEDLLSQVLEIISKLEPTATI